MNKRISWLLIIILLVTSIPFGGVSSAETGYTDLIISEYVEGSSFNKAIEIFNGTTEEVDLSKYSLALNTNADGTFGTSLVLSAGTRKTLSSGETLVISGTGSVQAIKSVADLESGVINFNGDDCIVLKNGNTIIDAIGQFGVRLVDAKDVTLSKKTTVFNGYSSINDAFTEVVKNTSYDVLAIDTFSGLGSYSGTPNQTSSSYTDLLITEYIEGSSLNKALEIFNGTTKTIDLSAYQINIYANGGNTLTKFSKLDSGDVKTLPPGGILVIANSGSIQTILDVATFANDVPSFNGNDYITLTKSGTIIDSFGQVTNSANYAKDKVFRRKLDVFVGDVDLTDAPVSSNEWEEFSLDSFDNLGTYTGSVVIPNPTDQNPAPIVDFDSETYYASAKGLTGDNLKTALNLIIDNHTTLSYGDAYDALIKTDAENGPILLKDYDVNATNNVVLFYTGDIMDGPAKYDNANGWNREHTWAKSHGDFGTSIGPGTDLHHLRATDVQVNSARGNLDFDKSDNLFVSGNYVDGNSWEPRDSVKGDVARMLFYMVVRYEGSDSYLDLELSESLNSQGNTSAGYGEHGKLSTLLLWHTLDPVDQREIDRNNVIYIDYQHNRNPFIDNPEYVTAVFGGVQ